MRSFPIARGAGCAAALVAALWVVYGLGWCGYDTAFALAWGEDIASGRTPQFAGPLHPTPHPLTVLLGVVFSPLGASGTVLAAQLLSLLALALLAWAGFLLGRRLFATPVGALFAALLVCRPLLVGGALEAGVDVPFLALVLWAAAVEAGRPRSVRHVLTLLAIAGLLRPEAWALSAAYLVYVLPGSSPRERLRAAAIAISAPAAWILLDLVVTGDALHSLHGTRELAERISRPRGLGTALDVLPHAIERVLGTPLIWLGLAGTLLALFVLYARSLLPAAVLGLGLAGFLVLGLADLSLLERYLLVPSAMLALFAAVALTGWTLLPPSSWRRVWMVAAVPAGVWLALSLPTDTSKLNRLSRTLETRGEAQRDLLRLRAEPAGSKLLARGCEPLALPGGSVVGSVALVRDRRDSGIVFMDRRPPPSTRLALIARTSRAARALELPKDGVAPVRALGLREAARNRSWLLYSRC